MATKRRLLESIYSTLAKLWPKSFCRHFERMFKYAGKDEEYLRCSGEILLLCFLVIIIFLLFPWSLHLDYSPLYLILALSAGVLVLFLKYLQLYFAVQKRADQVEEVLPDFLELLASNLKAGSSPFQALRIASQENFGILSVELEKAWKKSLGEASLSSSLGAISQHINSVVLERTLQLFITSLKSGASLASLLEHLARDVRETKNLEKEMNTNTKTYTLLIMFTVVFAMPLLLAVTLYFLETMRNTLESISLPSSEFGLSIFTGEIIISPLFLQVITYVLLGITSVLTSLLLGVITRGKAKLGLIYAPFLLLGCYVMFWIARYLISSLIGNFV